MKPREIFGRIDRLQRARPFKIGASILALLVVVTLAVVAFVSLTAEGRLNEVQKARLVEQVERAQQEAIELAQSEGRNASLAARAAVGEALIAAQDDLDSAEGVLSLSVTIALAAAVALAALLAIVWLGIAITWTALVLGAAAIAGPLLAYPSTELYGRLIGGVFFLTTAFVALLAGARALLSGRGAVLAVAANVISEAVRLKISLVFIVLLVLALPLIPNLLDASNPLRYRVQTFLQYSTSASFIALALLTLFFGCATVAFEQRDKTLWQTITKPIGPFRYLLGKWLGLITLNAVLLAVCAAGIFLFTEYLKHQTAQGEMRPFLAEHDESQHARDGLTDPTQIDVLHALMSYTEDRRILMDEVLTARVTADPAPPIDRAGADFTGYVAQRLESARLGDPTFASDPAGLAQFEQQIFDEIVAQSRTLGTSGESFRRVFVFEGLGGARDSDRPIQLRYKASAGGNRPDEQIWLTFNFLNLGLQAAVERETALAQPFSVIVPPGAINDAGELAVEVINGRLGFNPSSGQMAVRGNPLQVSLQGADGIQVTYSVGSFHANFLRVALVLWLKLAFLAMVAVWASTFLSFPVATLVAVSVFMLAESSAYVVDSVNFFSVKNQAGEVVWYRVLVDWVASAAGRAFLGYASLEPTDRLVQGRLLPGVMLAWGVGFLGTCCAVLYAMGGYVFSRRELALYSGQ